MKEFDLAGLHEDHSLKAQVAPPLSELCVRIIAQNFSNRPTLRGIPTRFVDRVTELLPTTLPLASIPKGTTLRGPMTVPSAIVAPEIPLHAIHVQMLCWGH